MRHIYITFCEEHFYVPMTEVIEHVVVIVTFRLF